MYGREYDHGGIGLLAAAAFEGGGDATGSPRATPATQPGAAGAETWNEVEGAAGGGGGGGGGDREQEAKDGGIALSHENLLTIPRTARSPADAEVKAEQLIKRGL